MVNKGTVTAVPAPTRHFAFLLGSARDGGNTERLARTAAARLPPGSTSRWITLRDLPLPAFDDLRHHGEGTYPPPEGAAAVLLEATLAATDLVIASPLYWYGVSAPVKLYLDHWTGWMRVPGVDFRARMAGRTMWAVTAYGGDDAGGVEPLLGTLRYTARYLRMRWGGELVAPANRPDDLLPPAALAAGAARFFR